MEIFFKKVRPNEDAFAPQKREMDADYDLFASNYEPYPKCSATIHPGGVTTISTNISIEFPCGLEGKIEEKSGLALKGLQVLGGVIDSSYTGEIIVIVTNISDDNIHIHHGKKVAQLRIRESSPNYKFTETTRELRETERGDGGFGSTGA